MQSILGTRRRWLAWLLAVALLCAALGGSGAVWADGEASLSISPEVTSVANGVNFDIFVSVDTAGIPSRGAQCSLTFNPAIMRVNSVEQGSFYVDWAASHGASILQYPNPTINNTLGTVSTIGLSIMGGQAGGPSGSGVFVIYHCASLTTDGLGALELGNVFITNAQAQNIPGVVSNHGLVLVDKQADFGDAPDPTFPTYARRKGAVHGVGSLYLGTSIDADANGQPTAAADGDDLAGSDDENGVTMPARWIIGEANTIALLASGPGYINAWADWNADGDWADAGEQILTNDVLFFSGNRSIAAPASAAPGPVAMRFRLSTQSGLTYAGPANDGEVEDYLATLVPAVGVSADLALFSPTGRPAVVGETVVFRLTAVNTGGTALTSALLNDTIPSCLTFVSATQDGAPVASWAINAGVLSWDLVVEGGAPIQPDQTVTIDLTFQATAPAAPCANSMFLQAQNASSQSASASDAADVEIVLPSIGVELTKNLLEPVGGPALVGGVVRFGVNVHNSGEVAFDTAAFGDNIPAELTFVSATQDGAPVTTWAINAGVLIWDLAIENGAPIAPGQTVAIVLTCDANAAGAPCNGASVLARDAYNREATASGQACVQIVAGNPPWDINADGCVDIGDVVRIGLYWGQMGAPGWIPEDVNEDGKVDIGDVVVIGLHWGEGC